jgi:hypothetical protein
MKGMGIIVFVEDEYGKAEGRVRKDQSGEKGDVKIMTYATQ